MFMISRRTNFDSFHYLLMKISGLKLLLFLVFIPAFLQAQNGVEFPENQLQNTDSEDFLAKNLPSRYYNELWTYHVKLENGVQIVNTFSINDFGSFKDRVTGVKLMVSWTDGNTYVVNKQYDPSDLINEADSTYLRLRHDRPYWAKGNFNGEHTINFQNTKDGVQYDVNLTFYDISKGKKMGDGVYKFEGNEIGMQLLMPHAKVRGYVAINGDTLQARGVGYMDHIYQNNLSTELIDRSYRVKTGDAENGMFMHFITLKKNGMESPIGYGVGYRDGSPYMITPASIEKLSSEDNLDSEVIIQSHQTETINVDVQKHFNTYSLLNELGRIQRFFAKRVTGGELLEMNGTVVINEEEPGYFYYMVAKD